MSLTGDLRERLHAQAQLEELFATAAAAEVELSLPVGPATAPGVRWVRGGFGSLVVDDRDRAPLDDVRARLAAAIALLPVDDE